jgi:hypothetical protein
MLINENFHYKNIIKYEKNQNSDNKKIRNEIKNFK